MKVRESGMPEEDLWESFFDPSIILRKLGLSESCSDVADFGCGYGTFSIAAAQIVAGKVYAFDLEPAMLERTKQGASELGLSNIEVIQRDFLADGSGLPDGSVDFVMLFNILHGELPGRLLEEAYRILRQEGKAAIIHWNHDPATPRGPPMEIRPRPEQLIDAALSAGFRNPEQHDLKPYHYGIVVQKG